MNLLEDLVTIKDEKKVGLVGLNDEFFSLYINKLFNEENKNILIVTSTLYEANVLNNFLSSYTNKTFLFPMDDFLTSESIAISPDLKITRLETLNKSLSSDKKIVITHLNGYLRYLPSKNKYMESILKLKKGTEIDREELTEKLISIGYERETIVTKTGELGVRGFVIDIFPIEYEHPIRIEFFGDEIDSIRLFDEENQKTIKELDKCEIYPNTEFLVDNYFNVEKNNQKYLYKLLNGKVESIYNYLDNPIIVFKDYSQIEINYKTMIEQILEYKKVQDKDYDGNYMFTLDDIKYDKVIYYNTINNIISDVKKQNIINYSVKEINCFN